MADKLTLNESYDSKFRSIVNHIKKLMPKETHWSYDDYRVIGDDLGGGIRFQVEFDSKDSSLQKRIMDSIEDYFYGVHCGTGWGRDWDYYISVNVDEKACNESLNKSNKLTLNEENRLVQPYYFVYAIGPDGTVLDEDAIDFFTTEKAARKFAEEYPYSCHIVFVPMPNSDESPEYAEYIKKKFPYRDYQIVDTFEKGKYLNLNESLNKSNKKRLNEDSFKEMRYPEGDNISYQVKFYTDTDGYNEDHEGEYWISFEAALKEATDEIDYFKKYGTNIELIEIVKITDDGEDNYSEDVVQSIPYNHRKYGWKVINHLPSEKHTAYVIHQIMDWGRDYADYDTFRSIKRIADACERYDDEYTAEEYEFVIRNSGLLSKATKNSRYRWSESMNKTDKKRLNEERDWNTYMYVLLDRKNRRKFISPILEELVSLAEKELGDGKYEIHLNTIKMEKDEQGNKKVVFPDVASKTIVVTNGKNITSVEDLDKGTGNTGTYKAEKSNLTFKQAYYSVYEQIPYSESSNESLDKSNKLTLNEDLFDEIGADKLLDQGYEINISYDKDETKEQTPETPEENGVARLILHAINGETDTIAEYNDLIANTDNEDIIKIIQDITAEENNHIGMLQKALELISPNASNIDDGMKEAEGMIDETGEIVEESLNEDLHDKFKRDIKSEYKSWAREVERAEAKRKEAMELIPDNATPEQIEKYKKFVDDIYPMPKDFKYDFPHNLERDDFPFYVTYYVEYPIYEPAEGGYYYAGNDAVSSKGFNTEEEAWEYADQLVAEDNYIDNWEKYTNGYISRGKYIGQDQSLLIEPREAYLSDVKGWEPYQ